VSARSRSTAATSPAGLRPARAAGPAAALALLLAAVGCAGSARGGVAHLPVELAGYPKLADSGPIWAQATFYTNHAQVFGTDLLDLGILPVALRVGSHAGPELLARLTEDGLDPHLYLPDGSALAWAPRAGIRVSDKRLADRLAEVSLSFTLLADWEGAREGFVFFSFDPERVAIVDTLAYTRDDAVEREMDLLGSLVSFHAKTEDGGREVFVGLRSARWTAR